MAFSCRLLPLMLLSAWKRLLLDPQRQWQATKQILMQQKLQTPTSQPSISQLKQDCFNFKRVFPKHSAQHVQIDVSWLLDNSFITQILMMTDSAEKVTCWIWIETIVDHQCIHARAQVLALFFVVFWEENYGSSDEEAHCDTLGLPDFPSDMADNDRAQ